MASPQTDSTKFTLEKRATGCCSNFGQKLPTLEHFWVPYFVTWTATLVMELHMMSWNWSHMSGGCMSRVPTCFEWAKSELGGPRYDHLSKWRIDVAQMKKRVKHDVCTVVSGEKRPLKPRSVLVIGMSVCMYISSKIDNTYLNTRSMYEYEWKTFFRTTISIPPLLRQPYQNPAVRPFSDRWELADGHRQWWRTGLHACGVAIWSDRRQKLTFRMITSDRRRNS